MIEIAIVTIPQDQQRYFTAGDWFTEEFKTKIRVSDLDNARFEFLIALHELVEMFLCHDWGIPARSRE